MRAIEVLRVYFGYEDSLLFKNLSLWVEKGEFFGIIGPNGAGKTTLLRLMAGLLCPEKGDILIFNRGIKDIPRREMAKIIGFVPQESFFAFDFSVLEAVLMGRNPYLGRLERPKDSDYEKAYKALRFTRSFYLKDKSINQISSGERQRVVLARALAQESKILLLDEVTSHLDITHQAVVLSILKELKKQGVTIVFLSHDINLASLYCDRILLLNKGEIVACDIPEKVISLDLIKKVYSVTPHITPHPETSTPQIILPAREGVKGKK